MGFTNSLEYNANNYMSAALAPVELANKQAIQKATWGHLAPRRNKRYQGHIVFSISAFGDMVVIDADFEDLPDSPWLFDAVHNFVFEDESLVHGAIYRFDGTFRNYAFRGRRSVMYSPKTLSANGAISNP
jgi:hypothetical protein